MNQLQEMKEFGHYLTFFNDALFLWNSSLQLSLLTKVLINLLQTDFNLSVIWVQPPLNETVHFNANQYTMTPMHRTINIWNKQFLKNLVSCRKKFVLCIGVMAYWLSLKLHSFIQQRLNSGYAQVKINFPSKKNEITIAASQHIFFIGMK